MNIKCLFGFHEWSNFVDLIDKTQGRTCGRCYKHQRLVKIYKTVK